MKPQSMFKGFLSLVFAAVLLAGCANQMEPAKKAIADIEAAVTAVGADGIKFAPKDVQAVNDQLADLKMKFDQKDYKGVLAAAPALLAQAQGLAGKVAEQKSKLTESLNKAWTGLSGTVPAALSAIQSRVDILSKSKKLPAGMDAAALESAKTGVADATALWNQATTAQSAGDMEKAIAMADQAKAKVDSLLSLLGMTAS